MSPNIDESAREGETALALSVRLAREKALAVAAQHPGAVVIGSDQVCCLEGRALGKPGNFEKACAQLQAMQGRELVFHTAVCVLAADGSLQECVSDTRIRMRPLSDQAIRAYVEREQPYDCAGSAKIEKLGIALMQSVQSDDPTSLIGLPLMKVTDMLIAAGLAPIEGLV